MYLVCPASALATIVAVGLGGVVGNYESWAGVEECSPDPLGAQDGEDLRGEHAGPVVEGGGPGQVRYCRPPV